MAALAAYAPALTITPRGYRAARITFPADSIVQAAITAATVVEHALGGPVIHLDVLTEREADERENDLPVPALVSAPEAAAILGVTQQRVRQMIAEGKLAAHRIGERAYALVRAEVEARAVAAA
ncbi:helix-turn-helix domain-containing protein [Microbacterium caowuchunii]|uniref:Helix-turn-helix domain-containing protein n=2 Tax=Microbacterium caowuchunii TaxID=2614638 RepID=A0A5N0TIM4_9MICO|nr:helix-turn-helix domain-containing protein [Microbacterium caowuchunii]